MKFLSFIGTWLPVFSVNNLEYTPGEPQKVKILNRNWVVWKDNLENVWSMQEDICPHKFAPLSQGRVEQKTGCIECPYHGWQFDTSGKCSKIPQNNANFDKNIFSILSKSLEFRIQLNWTSQLLKILPTFFLGKKCQHFFKENFKSKFTFLPISNYDLKVPTFFVFIKAL